MSQDKHKMDSDMPPDRPKTAQNKPKQLIKQIEDDNQIDYKANKLVLEMPEMLLNLAALEQKR
jgi:hypothetical protein